jgi:hypothetical protein
MEQRAIGVFDHKPVTAELDAALNKWFTQIPEYRKSYTELLSPLTCVISRLGSRRPRCSLAGPRRLACLLLSLYTYLDLPE